MCESESNRRGSHTVHYSVYPVVSSKSILMGQPWSRPRDLWCAVVRPRMSGDARAQAYTAWRGKRYRIGRLLTQSQRRRAVVNPYDEDRPYGGVMRPVVR